MNTAFVVFQLGFNIVVLAALLALAWREGRHGVRSANRLSWWRRALVRSRDGGPRKRKKSVTPPSPAISPLVERANRDELAAEAALRQRIAQFRQRREVS